MLQLALPSLQTVSTPCRINTHALAIAVSNPHPPPAARTASRRPSAARARRALGGGRSRLLALVVCFLSGVLIMGWGVGGFDMFGLRRAARS